MVVMYLQIFPTVFCSIYWHAQSAERVGTEKGGGIGVRFFQPARFAPSISVEDHANGHTRYTKNPKRKVVGTISKFS